MGGKLRDGWLVETGGSLIDGLLVERWVATS